MRFHYCTHVKFLSSSIICIRSEGASRIRLFIEVEADREVDSNFAFVVGSGTLPFVNGPGAGSELGPTDI